MALVAEQWLTALAGPGDLPVGEAVWIWEPHATRWSGPQAFVALREFTLEQKPNAARLLILADEEYVVWVNGTLVGCGRYRPGDPLDQYSISDLLRSGENRLVVELRSGRGLGGFFANLHFPAAPQLDVGSDERWHVSRVWRSGFLHDKGRLDSLPHAVALAAPPFGRWGPTAASAPRVPLRAVLLRDGVRAPVRRDPTLGGRWMSADSQAAGRSVTAMRADFRTQVEGLLVLGFEGPRPASGLLYLGDQLPDPDEQAPAALVVLERGQSFWLDAEMRRFRYALVLGMPGLRSAQLYGYSGPPPRSWQPVPLRTMRGAFGLTPPELRTPAEDEVWRHLQGLASGRRGKEGK